MSRRQALQGPPGSGVGMACGVWVTFHLLATLYKRQTQASPNHTYWKLPVWEAQKHREGCGEGAPRWLWWGGGGRDPVKPMGAYRDQDPTYNVHLRAWAREFLHLGVRHLGFMREECRVTRHRVSRDCGPMAAVGRARNRVVRGGWPGCHMASCPGIPPLAPGGACAVAIPSQASEDNGHAASEASPRGRFAAYAWPACAQGLLGGAPQCCPWLPLTPPVC